MRPVLAVGIVSQSDVRERGWQRVVCGNAEQIAEWMLAMGTSPLLLVAEAGRGVGGSVFVAAEAVDVKRY